MDGIKCIITQFLPFLCVISHVIIVINYHNSTTHSLRVMEEISSCCLCGACYLRGSQLLSRKYQGSPCCGGMQRGYSCWSHTIQSCSSVSQFLLRDVNKTFAEVTGQKANRGAGCRLEVPCFVWTYKVYILGIKEFIDSLRSSGLICLNLSLHL